MTTEITEKDVKRLIGQLQNVRQEIAKVIVGQNDVIENLLAGLLAGGHCLIEGVPGLAKTLLVRTLADCLSLKFGRIQFTPDLMPSDIVGTELIEEDPQSGKRVFKFMPGPVFANLVLADEINRTPPKTQAALLEAMQEHAVTYGGTVHKLDPPFFVLATQNPLEQSGTYELPEAQLDRFLLQINIDYPSESEELKVLETTTDDREFSVNQVMEQDAIVMLQHLTRQVHISDQLLALVNNLVRSTRPGTSDHALVKQWIKWGAGPRGGQALILAAKGRALASGNLAVTLADIKAVSVPVLRHRILLNFRAQAENINVADLITELVTDIESQMG